LLKRNTIVAYATLNGISDALSGQKAKPVFDSRYDTIQPNNKRDDKEGRHGLNFYLSKWTVDDAVYDEYARESLPRMQESLNRLNELLKPRDIRLTIAVYPWPDQVYHQDSPSKQETIWRTWSEQAGARFISHFPDFLQGETEEERLDFIRKHFLEGDAHWNDTGHALIAEGFLKDFQTRE
ncbi:MAG: hypothetical protein AAF492_00665, partial [Verrucomicrobiota bacterium]